MMVACRYRLKPEYMRSYEALRWYIENPKSRPVYVLDHSINTCLKFYEASSAQFIVLK